MNRLFPLVWFLVFLLSPALWSGQETAAKRTPLSPEKWSKLLREGDIVFIRSRTANAPLIAALSGVAEDDADNVFTHCGIIFQDNEKGLKVYEGEGRGAGRWLTLAEWQRDVSKGKVNGVEKSELHNVYVMRWNGQPGLTTGLARLLQKAKELHDTKYDHGFSWSDEYAYCSELIWKAFGAGDLSLGTLLTMEKYVKAVSPEVGDKIKSKLEEAKKAKYRDRGYVASESAVSPEDIYNSPHLIPVTDESR